MSQNNSSRLDFKFYPQAIFIVLLALALYVIGNFVIPHFAHHHISFIVKLTEHFQSFLLLFMAYLTFRHAQKVKFSRDKFYFWLWTISWWILIFGRGISWGRDFYPEVPRFYYKIIASILIAIPILFMFLPVIRKEIKRRYLHEKIPFWFIFLAFLFLGLSDVAEHNRIGHDLLVLNRHGDDLIEEFMEIPCFLGLAFMALYLQKNELKATK
ncbi:hypothetical protein RCS94_06105 [Orbaceae bacterium ac157xtp]